MQNADHKFNFKLPPELTEILSGFQERFIAFGENLNKTLEPLARGFSEAIEAIQELPERTRRIQEGLARLGWFLLPEMPFPDIELEKAIREENVNEIDSIMSAGTTICFADIENELCDLYPAREQLIREGFQNHREERYASAITLLLTQVDGICLDNFEHIFFSIKRGTDEPQIASALETHGLDVLTKTLIHPILIKSGINASENRNEHLNYPHSPNRHTILHGKDTGYAKELTSLKIISLLAFMGLVARQAAERMSIESI